VRVTSEQSGDSERGYVVTLDDITELVSAHGAYGLREIVLEGQHGSKT